MLLIVSLSSFLFKVPMDILNYIYKKNALQPEYAKIQLQHFKDRNTFQC